jgi:hypothetical protein
MGGWTSDRPQDDFCQPLCICGVSLRRDTQVALFLAAGSWPNTLGNANIVPVVANGKVFVAANKSLRIFGASTRRTPVPGGSPIASLDSRHVISGTLLAVDGTTLTLQTRNGKSVKIDDSQAAKNEQIGTPLDVGIPLTVQGSLFNAIGLQATSIVRAKGSSGELWPPHIF